MGLRDHFAASRLNDKGSEAQEAGNHEAALAFYQQAVERVPDYEPAWFNMGLLHKQRRQWSQALECNQRAAALGGAEGDPAWWNLGIAATALRQWDAARNAWRRFGIEIPDGTGELEMDLGPTPVRIDPDGIGEVVWGRRIDPARVVLMNVPTPASGHRWGDVVLHDGAPNGERKAWGHVYGVFDEIERWQPSETPTLEVEVTAADADAAALTDLFDGSGFAAQDWTTSVRRICVKCSEGSPSDSHEHPPTPADGERTFGLAAPPDDAARLLREWAATDPDARQYGSPVLAG